MLLPHLLPAAGDIARFGCILLIAACTTGMGLLSGARRLETALFSGWGLACLIFVAIGTWTSANLAWAAALCAVLGGVGLARAVVSELCERPRIDRLGLRVLVLGLPFLALVLGMADIAWDDFAFWVPNLLHLCATGRFPTLADPATNSAMAAYPYGVALPGFAMHLLGFQHVDTVALIWNLLAMLAACAAFANIMVQRMDAAGDPPASAMQWSLAALGVLLMGMLNPTFVAKITLTNMGDSATGAGLAVLCALLFQYIAQQPAMPEQRILLRQIALTCCAIVFIRQANAALLLLFLLFAAIGMVVFLGKGVVSTGGRLLATAVLPVFIWWSWTRYADHEIPGGRHYLLAWHAWHWEVFGATLLAASRVMIEKAGYTAIALAMGGIAVHCLWRRARGQAVFAGGPESLAAATMAVTTAGLAFGNIAFLLFCYLATSFDPSEAEVAIAFWRFIAQTGQSLTIGFACMVPMAWLLPWLQRRTLQWAIPAIALLQPVVANTTYRDDLTSPVPALRRMANDLSAAVPHDAPISLVDITGNGFAALVVRYQLRAVDGDNSPLDIVAYSHGLTAGEAREALPASAPYVWLAQGSPALGTFLGTRTSSDCAYLFHHDNGRYSVIRTWRIGRYRWSLSPVSRDRSSQGSCGAS